MTLTLYGQNFAERSGAAAGPRRDGAGGYQPGQQGAYRAGDSGDGTFRRLLLYAGNHPQLSGALSPVRIRLIDSSAGNVIEAVSSGQADFGLCFAKNLPASIIEFTRWPTTAMSPPVG